MIIPTAKPRHHTSTIELVDYLDEQRVQMHRRADGDPVRARDSVVTVRQAIERKGNRSCDLGDGAPRRKGLSIFRA